MKEEKDPFWVPIEEAKGLTVSNDTLTDESSVARWDKEEWSGECAVERNRTRDETVVGCGREACLRWRNMLLPGRIDRSVPSSLELVLQLSL